MKDELQDIWLRLEHADYHVRLLQEQVASYLGLLDDGSVVGHFDAEASQYVFRVADALPPIELGLVVGDALHGFRAALDNLIHALVVREKRKPTRVTQFPIDHERSGDQRKRATKQLAGVRPDHRAVVEAAQPYHWGIDARKHPLSLLREHSNADKHHLLPVAVVGHRLLFRDSAGDEGSFHSSRVSVGAGTWNLPQPYLLTEGEVGGFSFQSGDDRTEIMRVDLRNVGSDPQVEVRPRFALDVLFGDLPRRIGVWELVQMSNEVRRIVQAVEDQL